MKNTIKFFGIITLAVIIGFSMMGCDQPTDGGDTTGDDTKKTGDDPVTPGTPTLSGSVTITGDPDVGATLIVVTTALGGDGAITYQWKRDGVDIPGATNSTYTIVDADIGTTITVTVTRAGYSGSVSSAPTDFVTDPDLEAIDGTVVITGTAIVNQVLTADTSDLSGSGTIAYQWKRVGTGGATTIIGTNSDTYQLRTIDIGSTITVTVSRIDTSGRVTSDPTETIADLPALSGTVVINGVAAVGQTLTADISGLGGDGAITYQWKKGSTNIGTNSDTYTIIPADAGSTITVTVTRSENSGSVTSDPTATVSSLPLLTGTVTITGDAELGATLTADTSALVGNGTITYQWKRGETVVGTGNTYEVQDDDVGYAITVIVTRAGYSGSVTSEPTAIVIDPSLDPLEGTVSISGTAEVGQTLMAVTTALGGEGTISYQWKRGETIIGTNSNSYTVQITDVGYAITVTVTRSGNSSSVGSLPTDVIPAPALSGTVSISGTAVVGQTLTAVTTGLGGEGTISYQWKRGEATIGTNSSTYTVQLADLGSTITVTVTRPIYTTSVSSVATAAVTTPLTGMVTISGTAAVEQTLTADTSGLGGEGAISYQWKRGSTDVGTNSSTYTVVVADVGSTITVTVTRLPIYTGSVTSLATATVPKPVMTGTVTITGTADEGYTLTANTTNLSGTGTLSYQWKRGATVIGTNSSTYTVQFADSNSTVTVTVTRVGYDGEAIGSIAVPTPTLSGSADMTSTAVGGFYWVVGVRLTAQITILGSGPGAVSIEWRRYPLNGSSSYTVVGTGTSYTVVNADKNMAIALYVQKAGYTGWLFTNKNQID